jgi:hypothetical protein
MKFCSKCGSEEIRVNAWVTWNGTEWVIHSVYEDETWCEDCEDSTTIEERDE